MRFDEGIRLEDLTLQTALADGGTDWVIGMKNSSDSLTISNQTTADGTDAVSAFEVGGTVYGAEEFAGLLSNTGKTEDNENKAETLVFEGTFPDDWSIPILWDFPFAEEHQFGRPLGGNYEAVGGMFYYVPIRGGIYSDSSLYLGVADIMEARTMDAVLLPDVGVSEVQLNYASSWSPTEYRTYHLKIDQTGSKYSQINLQLFIDGYTPKIYRINDPDGVSWKVIGSKEGTAMM